MSALPNLTLFDARNALAQGDLCPVEYVEALLSRIDTYNGDFHALLEVSAEKALLTAKSLKKQRKLKNLPPLFGVPFLVKDIFDVEGSITTCQSRASPQHPANKTAECVQRLIDSGGIYLGKTALFEYALGGPDFDEPWPPARNPWNPNFTPGSSSSGSGAAVAAKFAPLALGTDTGGSIRGPAMMNGVVGLKPTFGRLSTKGIFPLAPSMDKPSEISGCTFYGAVVVARRLALKSLDLDYACTSISQAHGAHWCCDSLFYRYNQESF
ncbi:MAG: hypothetical protein COA78_37325 [Blastopirellula sp.]|nr:MAG: hypothetical protein COA78_37325 [Blastopirellula sp.]